MTEMPSSTYTWKLDTAKAKEQTSQQWGKYFETAIFKMHGCKWYIRFYPNYKHQQYASLFLYLCSLPSNASKIVIKRDYEMLNSKTSTNIVSYSATSAFEKGDMNVGWNADTLKSKSIANKTRFTINVTLTLLDVFDCNGKDITAQFENTNEQKLQTSAVSMNDNKYQEVEVRLNSLTTQMDQMMKSISEIQNNLKDIQLQMNEEQKNDNKDLTKAVEEIQNNMKMLLLGNKNNDNKMDKDKKEFKNWIEVKLKLPEYYDVFVENGVETLNVVKLLTKDELYQMGITKIGHKVQILKEIQQLQQKSDKPQEGGTAYI